MYSEGPVRAGNNTRGALERTACIVFMKSFEDLAGAKFGRLVVVKRLPNYRGKDTYYLCRCQCKNTKVIFVSSLKRGLTKSCGCLHREKQTKHGDCGTDLYHRWEDMKARVSPRCQHRHRYYDRGITVCARWKDYRLFKEDMGESFSLHKKKHGLNQTTLERIDNDAGYEPGNCKWATRKEQSANRVNTIDKANLKV